jgi:dehydrogenase/reductase SDR family protein 4
MEGTTMSDQFSLEGRNAIITGATRGIGLAMAKSFLEAGATVTLCGRKQEGVDGALAELAPFSDRVLGLVAHVGQSESLAALVEAARLQFGTVDVLVNNAGTNPYYGPILDSEEPAWDKTMDVNLKGPYTLSKLVAKQMADGGSIINIASIAGLTAFVDQGIYSVSKAGLIMLTKVMARELGRQKIRVNAICPGLIKTQLSAAMWSDSKIEKKITSLKALGRIGETDELTGAALYFASEASSFTTGAVLQVDGGMVI